MKKNISILHSNYIIDGVMQELTPAQILLDCSGIEAPAPQDADLDFIADETLDPTISNYIFESSRIQPYLLAVRAAKKQVPLSFASAHTRLRIAMALLDTLWRKGRFRIGDIALKASWEWNISEVGGAAAFYASVQAAGEYLDSFDIKLKSYSVKETRRESSVSFVPVLSSENGAETEFLDTPYKTPRPRMSAEAACPCEMDPNPHSWLVYIPFDTADYRLGGSLLAQTLGLGGGVAPDVRDTDYFIDCYEVVRELVEDGVLLSAVTVGDGGLLPAVKKLGAGKVGATIDISDIMRANNETQSVRLLFGEVPGVVVQIKDIDFDYLDAELLLQDVAFFPLGHPVPDTNAVKVKASAKSGIQNILESLIRNQGGEGED